MIRILALALGVASAAGAQSAPLPDAFGEGAAFGRSANGTARSKVTGEAARSVTPHPITTPAEASYFGGSGLGTAAAARLRACPPAGATAGSSTDPVCSAIDFSQTNRARRPSFDIAPTDPLLTRAQRITGDPAAIAGSIAGAYSACSVHTVTHPDVFEEATCHQYRTVEPVTCEKVRTVQVAWHNSCVPGAWFGNFWVNTWGNGAVGRRYAGIAINAHCEVGDRIRMKFDAVCTKSPCSGSAEIEVDAASGAASPQTFDGFIGRSYHWTDVFNRVDYNGGACNAERCEFSFCTRFEDGPFDCEEGRCSVEAVNITRACGTFVFERPRLVAEVTDSWDNRCAPFEARLP